ncbi:unnamed protein product [Chironomus riparius]|uniref:Uncharacterized protein n=1 Tax=Chironomus riparius TaxID=315576 RepID=A0A9N9RLA2_9DIPT|nr:unnamed protein product [Chironomus riparius]
MAFTLDKFLFCLELQLAGIICAWWGMIISALSVISIIAGLLFDRGNFATFLPFHVNVGGAFVSAVIMLIICLIYFYYSYQLLLGSNNGNASQMFGYLIIHAIVIIFFILMMFKNAFSILGVIVYCYLWFCVYSLYVRTGGTGIV